MSGVVVVTGASAGVGRAVVEEFARNGYDVALLARDPARLESAAADARRYGGRALAIPTDVADAAAVDEAALTVERDLGPIDIWVNAAMATVFAPVSRLTAEEFQRGTSVTYLGQVHGVMAALSHMRPRNKGSIVCVGSALAYRGIPLQSVYCGAKFAIRGFLDALRSELCHEGSAITLTEVDLPAINTPQFDWTRNKTGRQAQPVPPVFQPEVAARAIYWGAIHPRRQIWVGLSTIKAILANRLAPGLLDWLLACIGYTSQLAGTGAPETAGNLFEPVKGPYGSHGRFDGQAKPMADVVVTSTQWNLALAAITVGAAVLTWRRLTHRARQRHG